MILELSIKFSIKVTKCSCCMACFEEIRSKFRISFHTSFFFTDVTESVALQIVLINYEYGAFRQACFKWSGK